MQGKKALFLFLALLLPVSIFIFLKLFGKNEFDVPAFYQNVAPTAPGCTFTYRAPYSLPDSLMTEMSAAKMSELYLIHFSELPARITDEIKYSEVTFVDGKQLAGSDSTVLKKCILLVPKEEDLMVVDKTGKIRGYYSSVDREEVDRLLLEIEILLKKY